MNRTLAGRRAQAFGATFEAVFQRRCHACGFAATRIPDGCRTAGGKLFRVKSPFDWVVTNPSTGDTALIDTKCYGRNRISPNDVDAFQFRALSNHHHGGTVAGYVVWFRTVDRVVFFPVPALAQMIGSGNGMAAESGICLGRAVDFEPAKLFKPGGGNA